MLDWALRRPSATYVSISTLSEPIGRGILACLFLNEVLTTATAVGEVLGLTGI